MKKKLKRAFTLAEVLIALTIIGVIAALTVPTLMQNTNKQETVSSLKKAYSALAQAYNMSAAENGTADTWEDAINLIQPNSNIDGAYVFDTYFAPYLNVSSKKKNASNLTVYYLSDGSSIRIEIAKWVSAIIAFVIDINGDKGPNKYGRDLFYYKIDFNGDSKGKLLPYGYTLTRARLFSHGEGCSKNGTKYMCAALIMSDGWQIKEDYPW